LVHSSPRVWRESKNLIPRLMCAAISASRPGNKHAVESVNTPSSGSHSTRLTEQAHAIVRSVLQPGAVAVDATAGNGHDTRFLAECVGSTGRVFAFDIQAEALTRVAEVVRDRGNVTLVNRDHAELLDVISENECGRVGAVMFNLGYLPGGDKRQITRPDSTVRALAAALAVLKPGGVLTVIAYSGHPGGVEEMAAVRAFLTSLPEEQFVVDRVHPSGGSSEKPGVPQLFVVHKSSHAG
jgi:predicted methyltransferase